MTLKTEWPYGLLSQRMTLTFDTHLTAFTDLVECSNQFETHVCNIFQKLHIFHFCPCNMYKSLSDQT